MKPSPTMKMIALKAGVSTVTVSRALKNHPGLPQKTCLRIQKIASDMGYRPNPMLSVLMASLRRSSPSRKSGDRPVIAFLFYNRTPEVLDDPRTPLGAMVAGAALRAEALGYRLQRFRLDAPGITEKRMRQILRARGISGAILAPLVDPIPELTFDWSGLACATIGYSYTADTLHRVVNDQFGTIQETMRRLVERNYRRIGLVLYRSTDERTNYRWSGGYLSLFPHLPSVKKLPIFYRESARPEQLSTWLRKSAPEVIISPNPDLSDWMTKEGWRIPEDVSLVSLDVRPGETATTGFNRRHDLHGAMALDLVAEQLHLNEQGTPVRPKTITLMGDWVEGTTTRHQT